MTARGLLLAAACLAAPSPALHARAEPDVRAADIADVTVDPPGVRLHGPAASWSLLLPARTADGRALDLTRDARYRTADPAVAVVSETGVVRPVADGRTQVVIEVAGRTLRADVSVTGAALPRRLSFTADVMPVLSRYGCNASGCHGKAEGQNGFKLSVFGSDPAADFDALVKEGRGRRVFPASPDNSLLLLKAAGRVPHGGGVRLPAASPDYQTLRAWVAAGTPFRLPSEPPVASVRVEPRERVLSPHERQQLRVVARYPDGTETDVTALAKFQSNHDGVATVDADGLVRAGDVPGGAAVMVAYRNEVDVFRVVAPRPGKIDPYPAVPENNFIDSLVFARLKKLNIAPSDLADDAEFCRRVYLDVIGTLPTADEARRFLADPRPDKRARLVDELLERPEFDDYWALKWADLLRVDRQALGPKRAYAYHRWIHDALAANMPLDEFARALIMAEGPLADSPPASFYRAVPKPGDAASTLSQVFLGVRIACAECHHHPYDRWDQDDYHGMTAYFAGLAVKPTPRGEAVFLDGPGLVRHPRKGTDVVSHPLGEPTPEKAAPGDHRAELAAWMTRPDNPYFARNLANRVWAHLLGRGLVEPVDDVRATNPPTNPELLDALARHLVEHKYDLRALIRVVCASRTYQLSSRPNETNEKDEQGYSRAALKRVDAEVLLDMVCRTTGVGERFGGSPPGTRAIQLWDSKASHYFLKVYGRPERLSACECERGHEPSVAQVLHLLNSPEIQAKLSHEAGTVARLVKKHADDGPLVEELYLTFYGRLPDAKEKAAAVTFLAGRKERRRQAAEDLAWSLLNSLEFVFNH
jgi:hypothetical protein